MQNPLNGNKCTEKDNGAVAESEPSSSCDCRGHVNRRQFLQLSGSGLLVATFAGGSNSDLMAGPFGENDMRSKFLIPMDKQLQPAWVKSLYERGAKEVYKGKVLETIGMPCGGMATGQLYLTGDGSLGDWQIFGDAISNWIPNTHSTYAYQDIKKHVEQGFAVVIDTGKTDTLTKKLNKEGFKDVEFKGEYPIATVNYSEKGFPAKVLMEAFSPFIPLNAKDSALPATIFNMTVENTSRKSFKASILGWLENMVCVNFRNEFEANGKTVFTQNGGTRTFVHTAQLPTNGVDGKERERIVFEDFEGDSWGQWKVEGKAFGPKPTKVSKLEGQKEVGGIDGEGYVNSMHEGDKTTGELTSPAFTINRKYVNFLLGGGGHLQTSIDLVVDGKTVRTSHGWNDEKMQWRGWLVEDLQGKEAKIVVKDEITYSWGHINIDQIEFSDTTRSGGAGGMAGAPDYGNIALMCLNDASKDVSNLPDEQDDKYVAQDGTSPLLDRKCGLLSTESIELAPGQKQTFSFVMSWYFPNIAHGQMYAARFSDSADVAKYILDNFATLSGDTRHWRDIYYDSTMPYWLLDRLHSTMANMATGTTRWRKDGRFYAFEGCTCCHGTCTHVWSYAQGHARLFPEIGRNIRERQDFALIDEGGAFYPDTGLIAFRSDRDFGFAADGQCGSVLNAYREHLMSPDSKFLERNWPRIKKSLEYLIEQDAKGVEGGTDSPGRADTPKAVDARQAKACEKPDGIITGTQHNTYDINYHGANTLVGALYLAALRAGEEMAKEVGDDEFAEFARKLFENGKEWTIKKLWNGEYFVQDVDLEKHPTHQYKDGCLSDQIFGQFWAHQVGLGYLYPVEHVKSAIQSVWKYNWAPDITPYNEKHKPFRWFISPGQAGLLTCTWPKSEYLPEGTTYKNEVWTGIEYQVAAGLIHEGFVTEGLAVCKAIHDRYQPGYMNPYNEIECGDHYARAMASWGVYLSLAGFQYHGPDGFVGFAPKMTPGNFKSAFTFAQGWASFQQNRSRGVQSSKIQMHKGNLKIRTLSLAVPEKLKAKVATITISGSRIKTNADFTADKVLIKFSEDLNLKEGQSLDISVGA